MEPIGELFGRPIGQNWSDIQIWEKFLNAFGDHFKWIVELGTFEGGMSFYLYSQSWARSMYFKTIDIRRPTKHVPCFEEMDLKRNELPSYWKFVRDLPGVLFCDNGNKPAEVYNYHDQIHKESAIGVHDWGTEFLPSDIPLEWRPITSSSTTVFLLRNDFANELEVSKPLIISNLK